MKKVILFVSLFIILMLAGVALWAYFAFLYTKPLSKAELAELTPDWSVATKGNWSPWFTESDGSQTWNPAASFNAWLETVPEEDKAWPMLMDVQYSGTVLYHNLDVGGFPEGVDDWSALVEVCNLEESRLLIEQIKTALEKPVMGAALYEASSLIGDMNYTSDPIEFAAMEKYDVPARNFLQDSSSNISILSVVLPALGSQRALVSICRTYAIFELERGHVDEFIELTTISMDSAKLAVEIPTLLSQLVAMAFESTGMKTIEWALDHHSQAFTDKQLVELDQVLARHQHRTILWQGEAIVFHDTIRRMVDEKGSLSIAGVRTLQGGGTSFDLPTNLAGSELHRSTQRMLYANNKLLMQAKVESSMPLKTNGLISSKVFDAEKSNMNFWGKQMFDMLSPVIESASARFRLHQQDALDLRYLIAAHRHALRHGELPRSNELIDKDLLPD